MAKKYKDYCKEAVTRDPKTYSSCFNIDGSRKPPPRMTGFSSKIYKEIPKQELKNMKKDGWKPEVNTTRIKTRTNITSRSIIILKMPKSVSRKVYNRIWMHNNRAKQYLKKLKEKNGTSI